MSEASSRASAASTSDSNEPACASPGNANPTPTAGESSPSTGPTYRSMKTYRRLQPQEESMFSPEDFPAKTSVSLDAVPGLAASRVDYGLTSPASLANYDPATSSWRTSQASLLEEWAEFSEIWPRSGMTRSGTAYRLPPLAPHTYARGSSFWPTPIADSASGRTTVYSQGGVPLQVAVQMWPTPTANRWSGLQSHGRNAILGKLNPAWVEWLMGFPIGWTDCELSETASSPRSQSGSDAA